MKADWTRRFLVIYSGFLSEEQAGQIASNGHLSFDQYDQDQLFAIDAGQEGAAKRTMLIISDRGDYPPQTSRQFCGWRIQKAAIGSS